MDPLFEVGSLNGRSLILLEQVISNVFLPLLSNEHAASGMLATTQHADSTRAGTTVVEDDLLQSMRKFTAQLRRLEANIEGAVQLQALSEHDLTTLSEGAKQ